MSAPEIDRRLAVIMAADVAGYSRLMSQDEEAALATLSDFGKVIAGLVSEHRGRVFGTAGDSIMAEFQSAVQAVRCAVAVQRALDRRNADLPEPHRMRFRLGINLGDVMAQGDDLLGDGVNIAARLQALAEPGGILISGAVQEQIAGKLPFPCQAMGERRVKNIERPVRVFRIDWTAEGPAPGSTPGALSLPEKPSIAVLPFTNMSGDCDQEYFADGLTEDLITALAKYRWFFVIARNSSFTYKGRAVAMQQVARELGVRYVLEGSSRRAGERVRVSAQLVDAETGRHVWAERYDRDLADLFAMQDEIVERVIGALEPEMLRTETQRARLKSPENLSAWDRIFRGMWHFYQVTRDDHLQARALFRDATESAPALAEGHTWLARANAGLIFYGWSEDRDRDGAEGWRAASTAIRLAESDPYAHYALGIIAATTGQPDRAAAAAQKALDLSPNFALGYLLLGLARLFAGRAEQALDAFGRGLRLNPHDPQAFIWLQFQALAHYLAGSPQDSAARAAEATAMRPESPSGHAILAASLAALGEVQAARRAVSDFERAARSDSSFGEMLSRFDKPGDRDRLLEGLRHAGWREPSQ